jgi:hypothetical protein
MVFTQNTTFAHIAKVSLQKFPFNLKTHVIRYFYYNLLRVRYEWRESRDFSKVEFYDFHFLLDLKCWNT